MGSAGGFSQNTNTKTTGTNTGTSDFSKQATFGPEGQRLVQALSSGNNDAGRYYSNVLNQSGPSASAQALADAQAKEAQGAYAGNLAQVRSGGYGGGQGRDYINQANLASDFANKVAMSRAQVLQGDYEQQQAGKQQAASGLNATALQLLQMLRGESGTGTSLTNVNENANTTGKSGMANLGFGGS